GTRSARGTGTRGRRAPAPGSRPPPRRAPWRRAHPTRPPPLRAAARAPARCPPSGERYAAAPAVRFNPGYAGRLAPDPFVAKSRLRLLAWRPFFVASGRAAGEVVPDAPGDVAGGVHAGRDDPCQESSHHPFSIGKGTASA